MSSFIWVKSQQRKIQNYQHTNTLIIFFFHIQYQVENVEKLDFKLFFLILFLFLFFQFLQENTKKKVFLEEKKNLKIYSRYNRS
jgi:hypothetical protein